MLKRLKTFLAAGLCLAAFTATAAADYPDRPVTVIIPYQAGGGTDTVFRVYQKALEEELGQSLVVEYAGGAATLIGTKKALAARPDGYTLLLTTSAISLNTIMVAEKPYTMADFDIVGPIAQYPYALYVNDSQPFDDLDGFKEYAKANPGKLNYIHLGQGSPTRLLAERVAHALEVELTPVAYPGSGPAQPDFYSDRVQMQMASATKQYNEGPNTKVIAVAGAERVPYMPDIPTFKELGYPDVVGGTWFGLFAPVGLPEDVKTKLREALVAAQSVIEDELLSSGHYPVPVDAEGFGDYIATDLAYWKADLERLGEPVY